MSDVKDIVRKCTLLASFASHLPLSTGMPQLESQASNLTDVRLKACVNLLGV